MKRTVIFASYDKKGIIHDYVLNYLRYLKEIAYNIIFIADNEALPSEQAKLKDLCCHCEFSRHGEYDFGSYKRGFNWAKDNGVLDETDELILCNDSCFCVNSLVPVFMKMDNEICDFWGMTNSMMIVPHLQSYFLVFKRKVFKSKVFNSFINSVNSYETEDGYIENYELPLKDLLEKNGFISSSFIKASSNANPMSYPVKMIKQNNPLVKRKIFTILTATNESPRRVLLLLWKNYPQTYRDILSYYKLQNKFLFPILIPRDFAALSRFVFQKKVSSKGHLIIKICKIPLPDWLVRRIKK